MLSEEDARKIEGLEEELWKEETRFDDARMREVMDPEFMEIGRSGRIYQIEETLGIPKEPIKAELPLDNFSVRLIAPGIAQTFYNSAVEYDGVTEYGRRSSLWVKDGEEWRIKFHQGTPFSP